MASTSTLFQRNSGILKMSTDLTTVDAAVYLRALSRSLNQGVQVSPPKTTETSPANSVVADEPPTETNDPWKWRREGISAPPPGGRITMGTPVSAPPQNLPSEQDLRLSGVESTA